MKIPFLAVQVLVLVLILVKTVGDPATKVKTVGDPAFVVTIVAIVQVAGPAGAYP
jgi:hypothetical protein